MEETSPTAATSPTFSELSALYKRELYQVYEADGEVAAEANLELRSGVRWLTNLWVKHTHRQKGLGRQMLSRVVADYGAEGIYLHVLSYDGRPVEDEVLTAFYKSFGFVETGVAGILKRPENGS
ncbi:GNAT family N-acetyltransferase [Hymenobacter tenuis]